MPKTFICETCNKDYSHARSLQRHYSQVPDHKKKKVNPQQELRPGRTNKNAADATFEFLDVSKTNRRSRSSRVLKTLTEEEIKTFVLPRISSCIELYDIVHEQALITSNRSDSGQRISSSKLDILLHQFVKKLSETHPNELNNVLLSYGYTKKVQTQPRIPLQNITNCHLQIRGPNIFNHTPIPVPPSVMSSTLQCFNSRPTMSRVCEDISLGLGVTCVASSDETPRRQSIQSNFKAINQIVFQNNKKRFTDLSAQTLSCFNISRKDYQNILRNNIGKEIEEIIGCNPFVSRKKAEENLKIKHAALQKKLNLQFIEWEGVVAGFIDVKASLEWLLERKSTLEILNSRNDTILVYFYIDLFPWLAWSRFFQGETTIQLKLVEKSNLFMMISTACAWLGPDKPEKVSKLGDSIFKQIQSTAQITHPLLKKKIQVCEIH